MRVIVVTSAARQEEPGYIRGLLRPGDKIVCADAGAEVVLGLGLRPDLLVGDLDSIDPTTLRRVRAACPVRAFPVRKDKTDAHLAVELALEMLAAQPGGPGEVVVCGAFGDRFDHSLGLVLYLAGLDLRRGDPHPGVRVWLAGARQEAFVLRGGGEDAATLHGRPGDVVSLLPLSAAVTGVTTAGLAYPLAGATLRWGETLGVSNEMLGTAAEVTVENGTLLVAHLRGAW